MANNQYVNKVEFGNQTVMDITDTTAEEQDVDSGKVFYKANGERSTGTGSMSGAVWGQITGTLSDQTDLNTALNKKFGTNDTLTTTINDTDTIPYSTPLGVKALIAFSKIKQLIGSAFRKLLKDTVGWIGNNLADMSKIEIGISASGTANTKRARLVVPCESSMTYYVSASGTNRFTSIQYATSPTFPPESVILSGSSLPYSIETQSTDKYIIFQFNKSTDVVQDDIDVLKFMVSETQNDTYEPYHANVDEVIEQVYADNGVLGAKNQLIPYGYAGSGITGVIGSDYSVTLTGSSGTWGITNQGQYNPFLSVFKGKRVRLTGGKSASKYIQWYDNVNGVLKDEGNGVEFVMPENPTTFNAIYYINEQVTNEKFYPMLRLASDPDNTYVPYAMTNRELTDNKADSSDLDGWTAASTVANGSVSFSGLDDTQGWSYHPVFWVDGNSTNLNPTAELSTISGAGTSSMSVTYTTDADNGASCKLRIEK